MKSICIGLFAAAVGCAFVQPVSAAEEKVLYSFCSQIRCADGEGPGASLIDVNGTLYGTTYGGGIRSKTNCPVGCGTIFSLDPTTGTEAVLYSFAGGADGKGPVAGLTDVNGTLYGTTPDGGGTGCYGYGCGTIFELTQSGGKWTEKVLYGFTGASDGATPFSDLLYVNGALYGTTASGGASDFGTVFSIDPTTGTENVVYAFCSLRNCKDGFQPVAGLIDVNGTLYGTTSDGGQRFCLYYGTQCGTAFSLDPATGTETVLYDFCSIYPPYCKDGAVPDAALIELSGILYGTTGSGGKTTCSACGVVFSIDPATGTETVLHRFCSKKNCSDGAGPEASLIDVNGVLYGTTFEGGKTGCNYGCGTVFSVDPATGTETVLYAFCSKEHCSDGAGPEVGLIGVKGILYGTTSGGGTKKRGTVFEFTP